MDNIKEWARMTTSRCEWTAEDRSGWKEVVDQTMVTKDQASHDLPKRGRNRLLHTCCMCFTCTHDSYTNVSQNES